MKKQLCLMLKASMAFRSRRLLSILPVAVWSLLLLVAVPAKAQKPIKVDSVAAAPFRGHFVNEENGLHLHLDLFGQSLEAPGFGFLGKMGGYMNGRIYGTWMLVDADVEKRRARLRFTNDIGSDSQTIEFTQLSDSTFHYRTLNGNNVKKVVKRKLEKISGEMDFKRVKN